MWIVQAIRNGDWLELLLGLAVRALIIFIILPIHEFAHGWAAGKLGDPTARARGRLTFDPIAHVDPMGALFIVLFGFGWAKPVPVNPFYFRNRKRGMALTALAGPVSNLVVAFAAAVLYNILMLLLPSGDYWMAVYYFFFYFVTINISLAVFNLLPIPPLDGSRIFAVLLPEKWSYIVARYERYIFIVFGVIVFSGMLDGVLYTLNDWAFGLLMTVANAPFHWLGLF